jgi:RHS repeat-associated protein
LFLRYIYAGDDRIAMKEMYDNERTLYYLKDHLGTTRILLDETRFPEEWYYDYRAFGRLEGSMVSLAQDYCYTGKPYDEEGGINLYYYGARYYDDATGRFLTVDPLHGKYPGWSPYAYALNNPIKNIDPDGNIIETVVDVASVGLSAYELYKESSLKNLGCQALDVICAAIPLVPAVGAVRHAGKIDDAVDAAKGVEKTADKASDAKKITTLIQNLI